MRSKVSWKITVVAMLILLIFSGPVSGYHSPGTNKTKLSEGEFEDQSDILFSYGSPENFDPNEVFFLGPIMVDRSSMEVLGELDENGYRKDQFILAFDLGKIENILDRLPGLIVMDILGPGKYLVDAGEMNEDNRATFISQYAPKPYHSLMSVDSWFFDRISSMSNDHTVEAVVGSYYPWTDELFENANLEEEGYAYPIGTHEILVELDIGNLSRLSKLPFVSHISPFMEEDLDNDIAADIMDVSETWETLGLNGTGQIVAVADTGLDTGSNSTIHPDFKGRIKAAYAYGRTGNWSDPDIHIWDSSSGTWNYKGGHGTHVAGSAVGDGFASSGNYSGMAPEAKIVFQSTMNSGGTLSIPAYSKLFGDAYNSGARIHTNSWSSRSNYANYTWRSWQIDHFIWNHDDMLVLFSAGNKGANGEYSVSTQSSSKNVISVGASENYRPSLSSSANNISQVASFSSQGYTWGDGRVKPDVVAPGTWILSTRASTITDFWNHYWGSNSTYAGVNSRYAYLGGTSMSTPLVAGMATLIREYFEGEMDVDDPSAALIKASVINGARPMNGDWSSVPNRFEGWGRVNLSNSLGTNDSKSGDLFFIENDTGLRNGSSHTEMVKVSGEDKDLIATLVWSDFPGSNTSSAKLVNDLDLVITDPMGNVYNGNDMTAPFDSDHDRNNNVERVRIESPIPGFYNVTVEGYSVTKGPQPFALVATFSKISENGVLGSFKDPAPSNNSEVKIFLTDNNLTGDGSVTIFVNSSTDPAGETLTLTEQQYDGSSTGIFTGHVSFTQKTPGSEEVRVSGDEKVSLSYSESYPSRTLVFDLQTLRTPDILNLTRNPNNEVLTYTDDLIVEIESQTGLDAHFSLWGLDGYEMIEATDDGNGPDTTSDDGIYTGKITINSGIKGNFTLIGYVKREGLEPVLNISRSLVRINTDLPIRPFNLTVTSTDIGNSLKLTWETLFIEKLANFTIYRWNGSQGTEPEIGEFMVVGSTSGNSTEYVDSGIDDGVRYHYRVSSTDKNGLSSRMSESAFGTSYDLTPPGVIWTSPENGDVLSSEVELDIELDNDTESYTVQGALDPDSDGSPNGIWIDLFERSLPDLHLPWNTSGLSSSVWEGKPVLLRMKIRDDSGNQNITDVLVSVWIDNTAPSFVSIHTPTSSIQNERLYQIRGETDPSSYVELLRSGVVIETFLTGSTGEFMINVELDDGMNAFQVRAFDSYGNGPVYYPYGIDVVFDEDAPVPIITFGDNDTSKTSWFSGELSYDLGPGTEFYSIVEYFWNISYGDHIWEFSSQNISFKAREPGNYRVSLLVIDRAGNEMVKEIMVSIRDGLEPVIGRFENIALDEDSPLIVTPDITDDDPDILGTGIFRWFFIENGELISVESTLMMTPEDPGLFNIGFEVTDTGGNTGRSSFELRVLDITPPDIDAGPDRIAVKGDIIEVSANGTMDNSDDLMERGIFIWKVLDLEVEIVQAQGQFQATSIGTFEVILEVTDAYGNTAFDSFILTVTNDGGSPVVLSSYPTDGEMGHPPQDSLSLIFSEPMDTKEAWKWISIRHDDGNEIRSFISWRNDSKELTIDPDTPLSPGVFYSIILEEGLSDMTGTGIIRTVIPFRTADRLIIEGITPLENIEIDGIIMVRDLPASLIFDLNQELGESRDISIMDGSTGETVRVVRLGVDGTLVIPADLPDGEYELDLGSLRSGFGDPFEKNSSKDLVLSISRDDGGSRRSMGPLVLAISSTTLVMLAVFIGVYLFVKRRKQVSNGVDRAEFVEPSHHKTSSHETDHGHFHPGMGNQK